MTISANSITRHLKPSDIANEARMKRDPAQRRTGKKLAIVIVEGCADQLLYTTILDTSKCLVITAHGKNNAIQALKILLTENTPGVMGLVDDDFDSLEGRNLRSANLTVSDTHDLETLLFVASSLDKLMNTLLLPEKREHLVVLCENVRKILFELGSPIGFIRWLFHKENVLIDFRDVSFRAFIDQRRLTVDLDACVGEILSRNGGCRMSKQDIQIRLPELMKTAPYPWLLCQGHDLVKIFLLIMPQLLSGYAPSKRDEAREYFDQIQQKIPTEARITEQLIMCYEQDEFRKTNIYSDIKQWENRNSPYQMTRS
jgi:hypothetical protein